MKIAVVASLLGNFHANPSLRCAAFRPELQVIQMLGRHRYRGAREEINNRKIGSIM
jgi:hypothetical protein